MKGHEIGYRLQRAAWGKGIATEAGRRLVEAAISDPAPQTIVGCALATNAGSLHVLEKLGLRRNGQVQMEGYAEPIIQFVRSVTPVS